MGVSTISTPDRVDFDAIFQQMNLNLFRRLYARTSWQRRSFPNLSGVLFDPQRTFGNPLCTFRQSFASHVLRNRDLLATAKFSSLYAGASRVPPGAITLSRNKQTVTTVKTMQLNMEKC